MIEVSLLIISLIFVDNLEFIALETLIKKIAQILEIMAITILKQANINLIIYNMSKIEAILFFKLCYQQLSK